MAISYCKGLFLLMLVTAVCHSQPLESESILGTQFTVSQNESGIILESRVISSSDTINHQAFFNDTKLPTTCRERYIICKLQVVFDSVSERTITAVQTNKGIALALYSNVTTFEINLMDQYLIEADLSCTFTSLVVTKSNRLFASCLEGSNSHDPQFEVDVFVFEVMLNFTAIHRSYLKLQSPSASGIPYQSFSHGLSQLIPYTDEFDNDFLLWVDDETLFVVLKNFLNEMYFAEPPASGDICFGYNVIDVKLHRDNNRLLTYCANNTLLNYDIASRGGGDVAVEITKTRFFCSDDENSPYLEESNGKLTLFSSNTDDSTSKSIPHPLSLDERYVGDCAIANNVTYFIGSSANGTILLTDVARENSTVLASNSVPNHVLIDRRIVLYSGLNFSAIIDLNCPYKVIPLQTEFLLTDMIASGNYSCVSRQRNVNNDLAIDIHVGLGVSLPVTAVLIVTIVILTGVIINKCRTTSGQHRRIPRTPISTSRMCEESETQRDLDSTYIVLPNRSAVNPHHSNHSDSAERSLINPQSSETVDPLPISPIIGPDNSKALLANGHFSTPTSM